MDPQNTDALTLWQLRQQIGEETLKAKSLLEQSADFAAAAFTAVKAKLELLFERYKLALKKQVVVTSIIGLAALAMCLIYPLSTPFGLLVGVGILMWWRILLSPIEILGKYAAQIPGTGPIRRFVESVISQVFFSLLLVGIVLVTNAWRHPHLLVLLIAFFALASFGSLGNAGLLADVRHWLTHRFVFWSLPCVIGMLVVLNVIPQSIKDLVSQLAHRTDTSISEAAGSLAEEYAVVTLAEFQAIKKFSKKTGEPQFLYIKRANGSYLLVRRQFEDEKEKTSKPMHDDETGEQLQVLDKAAMQVVSQDLAMRDTMRTVEKREAEATIVRERLMARASLPAPTPQPTPVPTPTPEPDSPELSVVIDRLDVQDNNGVFSGKLAQGAVIRGKYALPSAPVQGRFDVIPQDRGLLDIQLRVTSVETTTGKDVAACTLTNTTTIKQKRNLLKKIGIGSAVGAGMGFLKHGRTKDAADGAVAGAAIGVGIGLMDKNVKAAIVTGTPVVFQTCHSQ